MNLSASKSVEHNNWQDPHTFLRPRSYFGDFERLTPYLYIIHIERETHPDVYVKLSK
jgi:hypothetical protein